MSPTLSKSDFILASSCPKKLIYKKAGYPTTNDTNEYMEMLAEGGYVIGHMATLYFPGGIHIDGFTDDALRATMGLMESDTVTMFEPAFESGQKLVRVDILVKDKNRLEIIEVKSKGFDPDAKDPLKPLAEQIEDVAFQYLVLSEIYPEMDISASLFLPDKSRRTSIDGLAGWFSVVPDTTGSAESVDEIITQNRPRFRKPKVTFKFAGQSDVEQRLEELRDDRLLIRVDVTDRVREIQHEIRQRAANFIRILHKGISVEDYQISKDCKGCEFKTPDADQSGFRECWSGYPEPENHIFDLYYGGTIPGSSGPSYLNELIQAGRVSMSDIDRSMLVNTKGEVGSRNIRQHIQLDNTLTGTEWISSDLRGILDSMEYPLHFIDFETYTGAVPFHAGMHPYELIAFQWSCHTIHRKGEAPIHAEWIHTGNMFPDPGSLPNFEFARSLMRHIGRTGTPLMWATHENTVLKRILTQMEELGVDDLELANWLTEMTKDKDRDGRWVDMNRLTLEHFFHPYMKGRTSIKKVLPAIWSHHPELHDVPYFREYAPDDFLSGIVDPYDQLTAGVDVGEEESDPVKGGTDAMRAYYRLRFEDTMSTEQKDEIRRQLLQYCRLDTMAMVIVWYQWCLRVTH